MPCPADPPNGQAVEAEVERFRFLHNSGNDHVNGNGVPNHSYQPPLTASKLVSHTQPLQSLDCNGSSRLSNGNGALFPSLKAIPISSYYKLHRVPSLSKMSEYDSKNLDTIQLPRRESTAEPPQEQLPQNGVHNKILEHVVRTPGRQPSPQPTHLSVPGSTQHKVLQDEGSGYVAPKFEGKDLQMEQGKRQLTEFLDTELMSAIM